MYTIHSLHEMQMTSRTPSIHVPRKVLCDLGLEATELVARHLPLAVEGAQLGSPVRDLRA